MHRCHVDACAGVVLSEHHSNCLKHITLDILLIDILYHRVVRCFSHQPLHLRNRCQLVLKVIELFSYLLNTLTLYFSHVKCLIDSLNCLHFLQSCEHLRVCRCLAQMKVPVLVSNKLDHLLCPYLAHAYQ